jgi:hypothetical protein
MLLIKNTINLSEIKALGNRPDEPLFALIRCFEGKKIKSALNGLESLKCQGFCARGALFLMLIFPLLDVLTIHSFCNSTFSRLSEAGKDVFYRLKNDPNVAWRKLQYALVKSIRNKSKKTCSESSGPAGPTCFVVDDSFLGKTGQLIEGVSRMWDHVSKQYLLGFKFLCLGYWDGQSFLPLDFSLHREIGKNKKKRFGLAPKKLKQQFRKTRAKGSPGARRHRELDTDKISNTISMLKRAAKNGFKADYLLVDSWFVCEKLILAVGALSSIGHLIGLVKMGKAKYDYKGKKYSAKELENMLRNEWKRARKLKIRYIEVKVEYKGTPVVLFLTRIHGNSKTRLLLSTNTKLRFNKAFEIYAIRWTIEVFFKESKQLLGLGKCQSKHFDAQIADATLSIMRYTILSYEKQKRSYQTLGGLFREFKSQTTELLLNQRIWGLLQKLLNHLGKWLDIDWQQLMKTLFVDDQCCREIQQMLEALSQDPEEDTNEEGFLVKQA